ncbi:MAG: ABC transporter ATP-binding protein [Micavibrio aeruginosavorus]|uniref:ABC transporter ATP-binding protein n=1 Tax=Micavibrio aeruginosavorus TaxID=349221 RepID=A0A2W5A3X8_9BACT|nr:MAG: ABC transporter ATP-binding protein [Micavibrio aeruginosavorus]
MTLDALTVTGVDAGYDRGNVISNISLNVRAGETYGLIGLNGAGKTTLLKTILGLKDRNAGDIRVFSHPAGSREAKQDIAFLPERFDPAWFLNAYEFINFTLALYGRKSSHAAVDAMADRVGLNRAYLKQRAQSYSKGMRQKLGLISTFLTASPLLILDEPMSGLDPLARVQVKSLVRDARAEGRTVFLSSHILSDMEELCDNIAVLHGGKIVFTGTPQALLQETGIPTLEQAFLAKIGSGVRNAA